MVLFRCRACFANSLVKGANSSHCLESLYGSLQTLCDKTSDLKAQTIKAKSRWLNRFNGGFSRNDGAH